MLSQHWIDDTIVERALFEQFTISGRHRGYLTTLLSSLEVNCIWHYGTEFQNSSGTDNQPTNHLPKIPQQLYANVHSRATDNVRWLRVRVRFELWTHRCVRLSVWFLYYRSQLANAREAKQPDKHHYSTLRTDKKLGTQHTFDYVRLSTNILKKNAKNSGTYK